MQHKLIGQTLGQYQIVEQLGQGGMATVFKAYQPRLEREVAVKVLPAYFAHDPQFSERFRREAKAIARLDHPNIVPVYDSGEEQDIAYIVMKYVEGGTLKERLEKGRLDLKSAVHIVGQVADALTYAHEQGIVHRDVKPANILMPREDWAQLTDFGIAKAAVETQALTGTGVGVGTPEYMAPEQASGKTDGRVDVYSLGVTLYQMVTGQLPYTGETPMGVVIKHMQAPLPLVRETTPNVPESVERIILKTLAKDPDDRFQTPNELSDALQAAIEGLPISVELPSLEEALGGSTLPMTPTAPAKESRTAPLLGTKPARNITRLLLFGGVGAVVAVIAVIALVVSLLTFFRGNQTSTAAPVDESPPAALPPDGWSLVIQEPFDSNTNGWQTGDAGNSSMAASYSVTGGKYRWETETQGSIDWFYWNEELEPISDFYYTVEIEQVSGPDTANYGMIFRAIDTAAYLFSINDASQQYALFKWEVEGWTYLLDTTRTSAIKRGEANQLGVLAEGSRFSLYINDEYVDEITVDDGLNEGRVGLAIYLGQAGDEAVFEFDNFEVYTP
jgi:serine/threonine protein kinase